MGLVLADSMTAARTFSGVVASVHDGDSITVRLDLGFRVSFLCDVRLDGINAAELATPGGKPARDHLIGLAPVGSAVTVTCLGPDKYGNRWNCRVIVGGVDVSERMIADGYAAAWDGNGVKPVPPWPLPAAS